MIDIRILFDNYKGDEGFHASFGYSCFIKKSYGGILFDTGADSQILIQNIKKAKINPAMITKVVLSHYHKDHTTGLKGILELKNNCQIYVGSSCIETLMKNEQIGNLNIKSINETPLEIMNGVYLTGELGEKLKEISVVMDTGGGLVVITGCAHAGLKAIFKKAKEIINDNIFALIGGLHLKDKKEDEILHLVEFLKNEGIKYIAPSHCTGDLARKLFKDAFNSGFIEAGAGTHIYIGGSCDYV